MIWTVGERNKKAAWFHAGQSRGVHHPPSSKTLDAVGAPWQETFHDIPPYCTAPFFFSPSRQN